MDCLEDLFRLIVECYDSQAAPIKTLGNNCVDAILEHIDPELRCWLAKALVFETDTHAAVDYLTRLSGDDSTDVRLEALDSLCVFACFASFWALCSALKDTDILIRSVAAYGVASTGVVVSPVQAVEILSEAVKKESSERVLVNMYEGLYILGDRSAITNMFTLINSEDYHVQAALLRALVEILDTSNVGDISAFAFSLNELDFPCAVVSALQELNSALDQISSYST